MQTVRAVITQEEHQVKITKGENYFLSIENFPELVEIPLTEEELREIAMLILETIGE